MPLAVTHVLLTIILVDLYRDYFAKHKKYFTIHTLFIAGLGGLLPDIDIPIDWLLGFFGFELAHRAYTHTIAFALLFLIPGLIFWYKKKHKLGIYFFVITFGILFHIFLDFFFTGSYEEAVMILWPFSSQLFHGFISYSQGLMVSLDAILLLAWLYHEEKKHKILDYI